jgi:Flp pilus assembly pilin Flp
MQGAFSRFSKNTNGATAIEFAMVAPALFLLIMGIIEFGILFATQSALEGAASTAARKYKALALEGNAGADVGEIHSLISQYSGGLVSPGRLRVTAVQIGGWGGSSMPSTTAGNSGNSGTVSQVIQYRIYYDYPIHTPRLSRILSDGSGVLTIRASTVVQNEPPLNG